ncbi:MFS transporter [Galactobacter caseinivorans]|uniref:MFS transporter n=1 Tax=Galactobacter caseinivorans TaxID=2676123 RepID=A0A496PMC9_9MICC|nr:MFS transporter [Galactobacter caseinivorans]RKW71693.1 MFS transporter [Galactobacter caseinivorans]
MSAPATPHSRAWLVWGAAVLAYLVSVTQRTSFGIAGLEATERYDASASILATFSVVQLLVYAGMQIPVGALVDRFGSRKMIAGGAALMGAGQLVLAFSDVTALGFLGRVLVGAGDAMTFVSVMRLLPAWFPPRRNPIMAQLTGMVGQVGQIVSLVPFAALLHLSGWTSAFLSLAGLSVLAFTLAAPAVRDRPSGVPAPAAENESLGSLIKQAWAVPGTRLAFWTHWISAFGLNVFLLSWGYPFLVSAQGVEPAMASTIMALFVVVAIVFGPVVGTAVARFPLRRSNLVLLVVFAAMLTWSVVLLWPGRAPLWLLVVLALVVAAGGPTSMVAFDFARTENPPRLIGTATGLANVGAFSGALIAIWSVGVVLDLAQHASGGGRELYSLDGFRLAFLVLFVFYAVGLIGFFIERRRTRRLRGPVPPLYRSVVRRLHRG